MKALVMLSTIRSNLSISLSKNISQQRFSSLHLVGFRCPMLLEVTIFLLSIVFDIFAMITSFKSRFLQRRSSTKRFKNMLSSAMLAPHGVSMRLMQIRHRQT